MKALHERLERERIEREKKHAQQQADLKAQLARDLAPLRRHLYHKNKIKKPSCHSHVNLSASAKDVGIGIVHENLHENILFDSLFPRDE